MDRQEAEAIIAPYVEKIDQYSGISHANCLKILGEEVFGQLLQDVIRSKGPKQNYIYSWNIVDGLLGALSKRANNEKQS